MEQTNKQTNNTQDFNTPSGLEDVRNKIKTFNIGLKLVSTLI